MQGFSLGESMWSGAFVYPPHNAAVHDKGPYGKGADRIQIGVARSWRSETLWFFRPRLIDCTSWHLSWPLVVQAAALSSIA